MSKGKLATTIIMLIIFVAFAIFAIVYYFGESYSEFYKNSTQEFEVAGLDEGFTPQGISHEEENDIFLVGGYMSNGSASRIYVVDGETNQTEKYFTLAYLDNETQQKTTYAGHCGGVATDGNGVWVVGDKTVYYFKYDEVLNCENKEEILIENYFTAPNGADFVTVYNNKLLIGEFHREGNYDTDESHFIETKSGLNKAVSFMYDINNNNEYGLENLQPVLAISTPSLVQGMVITDNNIILSTSYSLPSSHLYFYDNILNTTPTQKTFEGVENAVDTYILDTPVKTIKAPCMSEEITLKDNTLYVLFENACNKYKYFTRDNLTNVFALNLEGLNI